MKSKEEIIELKEALYTLWDYAIDINEPDLELFCEIAIGVLKWVLSGSEEDV